MPSEGEALRSQQISDPVEVLEAQSLVASIEAHSVNIKALARVSVRKS